jgi:uncharacterized protein (TIGR00725 family)
MQKRPVIAVIGGKKEAKALMKEAEEAGRLIAEGGAVLVSGGLNGVMESASKGARSAGGLTVGILPQDSTLGANSYIDVAVATGLGIGRNVIIARTADALIAIGGKYGTLSEIAFALQLGKPVVGIRSWDIRGMVPAVDAADAVAKAFAAIL